MENANVKEARPTGLAERVVGRLAALKMNKAELAIIINLSRPMVSQYLSGKYTSNPATIEKALEKWLAETEPVQADQIATTYNEEKASKIKACTGNEPLMSRLFYHIQSFLLHFSTVRFSS